MAASPSSPWFALIDPREVSTFDDKVHFDANMFWTVATLFKYFGTSGVEQWDREIDLLKQTHQLAETNVGMPTSMQRYAIVRLPFFAVTIPITAKTGSLTSLFIGHYLPHCCPPTS